MPEQKRAGEWGAYSLRIPADDKERLRIMAFETRQDQSEIVRAGIKRELDAYFTDRKDVV